MIFSEQQHAECSKYANPVNVWQALGRSCVLAAVSTLALLLGYGSQAYSGKKGPLLTPIIPITDLGLVVTRVPEPVGLNQEVTYTATITNLGDFDATGVEFSQPVLAGWELLAATASQGSCAPTTGDATTQKTILCPLGEIGRGGSATVTIEARPTTSGLGVFTVRAAISGGQFMPAPEQFDPNLTNNEFDVTSTVSAVADFILSAIPASRTALQGQSVEYTVTLQSLNGFDQPVDLSVASGLPSGASAVFSPNPVTPTVAGSTSTLTIGAGVATPPETYIIGIQGVGGGQTHLTSVELVVNPAAQISLDARTLTVPTFDVAGITDLLPTDLLQTVPLAPGTYTVRAPAQSGAPSFQFSVLPDGTVDFATGLDGFLAGRGSSTVQILGVDISLDVRQSSAATFDLVNASGPLSATDVQDLRVLPGPYTLRVPADGTGSTLGFTVNGQCDVSLP